MKKKTLSDFRGAVPSKGILDFEEERRRAKKAVADRVRNEDRTETVKNPPSMLVPKKCPR